MKTEWRKHDKKFYLPKDQPVVVDIPNFKFISIEGIGNPNSKSFSDRVAVLYSLSYGIRMSYKWDAPPANYNEYTVYPLEGVWDINDVDEYNKVGFSKDNLKYKIMIRQPDFLDKELYQRAYDVVQAKKKDNLLMDALFEESAEGLCVQMLHKGSFDTEDKSFKIMENFCDNNSLERLYKTHREIYLSDPRKTTEDKLKTVLRFNVKTI